MIPRVTQQTVQRQTLANLQGNLSAMAALQAQMSSGKKINVAVGRPRRRLRHAPPARRAAHHRRSTRRNAADGDSWLTTVDTALHVVARGAAPGPRPHASRAATARSGTTSRDALAAEIEGVRDSLLEQANATYVGRTVFAGHLRRRRRVRRRRPTRSPAAPRRTPGRAPGRPDATVRVDSDGAAVFGDGAGLGVRPARHRSRRRSAPGGDPTTHLDAIDTRMEAMLTEVASVGARHDQVHRGHQRRSTEPGARREVAAVRDRGHRPGQDRSWSCRCRRSPTRALSVRRPRCSSRPCMDFLR